MNRPCHQCQLCHFGESGEQRAGVRQRGCQAGSCDEEPIEVVARLCRNVLPFVRSALATGRAGLWPAKYYKAGWKPALPVQHRYGLARTG